MKKKLESELISIAHRILKLKGKEDVKRMHAEAALLYEKLSVLKFAQENYEEEVPTIGHDTSFFESIDQVFNNKISDNIEVEDKVYINLDDVEHDDIMEPAIEKIKDIVAQMPHEAQEVDVILETTKKPDHYKIHHEDIAKEFQEMPIFEPVSKNVNEKKSLNDKLKSGGLNIGLNDKLAFIKHLFEGKVEDYERVISQINTSSNYSEASNFIQNIVKPDYDWDGKEQYEDRLMELIEGRFN
ncbi:MAG TPA: hypothetical protein PLZ00_02900 [Mangrovimonas sp.]|nr:hypothetical protein [Mangrovimonas sp.]